MSSYQYVVIVGAPFEKQTIYGPFPTLDDASEWADGLEALDFSWILTLEEPST